MILLQRTNGDWWQVRKADATEGFVPANYVKEVDPKVVQKVIKQPVKVPEKVKVKKTVMKKEVVMKKKTRSSLRRAPSGKKVIGILKPLNYYKYGTGINIFLISRR